MITSLIYFLLRSDSSLVTSKDSKEIFEFFDYFTFQLNSCKSVELETLSNEIEEDFLLEISFHQPVSCDASRQLFVQMMSIFVNIELYTGIDVMIRSDCKKKFLTYTLSPHDTVKK